MITKDVVLHTRFIRIRAIFGAIWIIFLFLIARLFYLQIDNGSTFSSLGEKNFLRIEIIPPLRGDVYDCNHILLAANRPVFDLFWNGKGKTKLSEQEEMLLNNIGAILSIDFLHDEKRAAIMYAERYSHRLLLKNDVDFGQLCQISEQCADASSLVISNRFKRVYPHQELACHILGYLNRTENSGQSGVERTFESTLQGKEGRIVHVINATGKTLAQHIHQQAQAGFDLELTIDIQLQKLAESLFEPEQAGALILMDPETGAVKALCSFPQFDPNIFLHPLSEESWDKLTLNNPLLNRATNALYPPASLFKLVTFAAGLGEKIIDTTSPLHCDGFIQFCDRKYLCMKHSGHGTLSPKQALAVSCNVPCFQIARKIKIDRLAAYAYRFGLGKKTNFLLPERDGLVPTSGWKRSIKGERWWKGENLSVSIGQGYLLVTPLQIARMFSSICTGYLVKPLLLQDELIEKEKLDLPHDVIAFFKTALKDTVDEGTGRMLGRISSFDVSAKTGTAQICSLSREKTDKSLFEHGWFAGYFSYKGQKPLTLVILLENVESSHFAVQLAYRFLNGYKDLMVHSDEG